jgi:hypothetical protein
MLSLTFYSLLRSCIVSSPCPSHSHVLSLQADPNVIFNDPDPRQIFLFLSRSGQEAQ